MRRILGLILIFCLLFIACETKEPKLFVKLPSSHTGINFANHLKDSPELNILTYLYYYNGAGVAAADFNNDGQTDLYFTSNQGRDRLYLNEGGMKFKDVTETAGIEDVASWSTGVTYADINGDGWLDIYICKASGYRSLKGQNLLYINKGVNDQGIPLFEEESAEYGLNFAGLSTQAAFLDYDLDGDLDMFLMNHSVHPNRAYGRGSQREAFDPRSGDRLFRNENGLFNDVSAEAGIFQGKIGYGLGLGVSDVNSDGYPDIYIGNDFFENDYLYINQQDGTFREIISEDPTRLGHTTHYSMGNDLADVNNDGLVDIVSLDMLPEDLETYKASGLEFAYPTYQYYLLNGYAPQYMQNTLHLNLGDATFSEIGHLSGIAATEWSWSALLADFDNDGLRDLFISNGIKGATNNMDFVNFISNEEIQRSIDRGMTEAEMDLIDKIPETKVANYFYQNIGDLKFKDVSEQWHDAQPSFSHGSVYADLDNDGDLDLVVNNVEEEAYILENNLERQNNYIQIQLKGPKGNTYGIGAKVTVFANGAVQYAENQLTRGYLSAVPPVLHFGLGSATRIDSLVVAWPGGKYQSVVHPELNQQLILNESNANREMHKPETDDRNRILTKNDSIIPFTHKDLTSIEFNRDPLVPFASTNEGPALAVADVNGDGLEDVFLGGAKRQPSALFIQEIDGNFTAVQDDLFKLDEKNEDVSACFFDANADGRQDLIVLSGGNEYRSGIELQPRLYINSSEGFYKSENAFSGIPVNASAVAAADFDGDGDMDLAIGSDLVPWEFGKTPEQYLFENNGDGDFKDVTDTFAPDFRRAGNINDLIWQDLDGNGYADLIVAGYWMPVRIYMNSGKEMKLVANNGLDNSHGWWSSISVADIDKDGDLDIIGGNFGENSLLKASYAEPVSLYRMDFDQNGSIESLVTYYKSGQETPLASKDELVKQMPFLNKEFLLYGNFAKATLEDLFSSEKLEAAEKKYVYTLSSKVFINDGQGNFETLDLPSIAQASTVQDLTVEDIDGDSYPDLILVGNKYEISTQLGSMDASHGVILQNDKNGGFRWLKNDFFFVSGPARRLDRIKIKDREFFVVAINNGTPVLIPNNN